MYNPKLIEETIRFWSPLSPDFTVEDARQAIENIRGFFEVLQRWSLNTDGLAIRAKVPMKEENN